MGSFTLPGGESSFSLWLKSDYFGNQASDRGWTTVFTQVWAHGMCLGRGALWVLVPKSPPTKFPLRVKVNTFWIFWLAKEILGGGFGIHAPIFGLFSDLFETFRVGERELDVQPPRSAGRYILMRLSLRSEPAWLKIRTLFVHIPNT